MNTIRLEALSDGIFAIAMTLLIFEIKVPVILGPVTDAMLVQLLQGLAPEFIICALTFIVLSVIWMNHRFLFTLFTKEVDRWLTILNMIYLMFIMFVPFSAQFIWTYIDERVAVIVYGVNIFAIVFLSTWMFLYVSNREHLSNDGVSRRTLRQARFRSFLSLFFYPIGIICAFVWIPASLFFYAFPVVFNFIPGTLDLLEKYSHLDFGEA
jgi:TMEM175 potassium channel family protein